MSGMIKNEEALFFMISTAYQNPNTPLREDIRIIAEVIDSDEHKMDDNFLGVWSQDSNEEIWDESTWIKSNPLLGLEEQNDKLFAGLKSGRDSMIAQGKNNDFLVKNMNVWVNDKDDAAFVLQDVERVVIDDFDIDDRDVYIGFDNSMISDDASLAFVFPYEDENGNQKWHLYQHSLIYSLA